MTQLYAEKMSEFQMQPKKETIQFLLDFSKSIKVIRVNKNFIIELDLN